MFQADAVAEFFAEMRGPLPTRPTTFPEESICASSKPGSFIFGSVFETKYVAPYIKKHSLEEIHLQQGVWWQQEILEGIRKIYMLCEEKKFGYEWEVNAVLGIMWMKLLVNKPESSGKKRQKD